MTAHQLRKLGADCQAKAGSSEPPGYSAVGLGERLEDMLLVFF